MNLFSFLLNHLWGEHPTAPLHAHSSDLAVVYDDNGEAAAASFTNEPGSPLALRRFTPGAGGETLARQIAEWRNSLGLQLHPQTTSFVTATQTFTERTRILPLPLETEDLDDTELLDWLLQAATNNYGGLDEQPLFDGPLDAIACDYNRTPSGQVTFTEAPWPDVRETSSRLLDANSTVALLERLSAADESHVALRVETFLRGFVRSFAAAYPHRLSGGPEAVTAFFLATESGVVTGLWSSGQGLFHEFAEDFRPAELGLDDSVEDEYAAFLRPPAADELDDFPLAPDLPAEIRNETLLQNARNLATRLQTLQAEGETFTPQVVWCAAPAAREDLNLLLEDFARRYGWELVEVTDPLPEFVAEGLLLGSTRGPALDSVPLINLISPLRQRADESAQAARSVQVADWERKRRRCAFALAAPVIIALGVVAGSWLNSLRVSFSLARAAGQAQSEAARLKPIAERRRSFVENFKWYQAYCQQILDLRQKQTAAIGLYADLEPRWPLGADDTFFVTELRVQAGGQVEIKGYTRSEEAVTTFVRGLEFSDADEQGRHRFTNIAFEVKQGAPANATAANSQMGTSQPTFASTLNTNLAPGVVAWKVTALYGPLAERNKNAAAGGKAPSGPAAAALPANFNAAETGVK
jgi:hypothetical protein